MALLILGLILFVCLVIVHEWGHYKAARQAGVEVEEFGLGFPPKVWGKRLKSKMLLSINLLPLGGFVKLKGEHDSDNTPGSYGAASLRNKIKIMTAGVAMNLATGLGILTFLALIGMPRLVDNQFSVSSDTKTVQKNILVAYVEPGSPAERAGLKARDQLLAVHGPPCSTPYCDVLQSPADLSHYTSAFSGLKIGIKYSRGGEVYTADEILLRSNKEVEASKQTDNPKGYLGVVPTEYALRRSTWSAPIVAVGTAAQFTKLTLQGIGAAIGNVFQGNGAKAAEQVSGPVGIFVVIKDGATLGYRFILMIIAIISLTLAIMNILPIPALDGGRLFVTLLYRVRHKKLTKEVEERIHGAGFIALMGLFLLITVIDVRRFF